MHRLKERKKKMKYKVCFTKHYIYEVEADTEDEAINLAFEDGFYSEMHCCIADCGYDEVEIWESEE